MTHSLDTLRQRVAAVDKVEQLEEDLMKVINYTRDIQQQVQQTNKSTMRLKEQMGEEMEKVQRDILDKTMKYKSKIYQRIQQIQDLDEDD